MPIALLARKCYNVVMENNIHDHEIIEFVRNFTEANHYGPAIRDFLSIGFTSTSHVRYRIDKLVEAGRLGRDPKVARSIYVKEA